VTGCYRRYFQCGGAGGWLGLPIAEPANTPDGQRQAFEGGTLTFQRVTGACEATPSTTPSANAAASAPLAPLDLFENAGGDAAFAAARPAVERLLADGYRRVRTEALVPTDEAPGMRRLKLYGNESAKRHETVATDQSETEALDAGYVYAGLQGFVRTEPAPGWVALKRYRDAAGAGRLTAGPQDEAEASRDGFAFVRIEGYAVANP
ncbi:MAG: hypothetical protein ABI376_05245, partial [Caulobacteraceae bacterium]